MQHKVNTMQFTITFYGGQVCVLAVIPFTNELTTCSACMFFEIPAHWDCRVSPPPTPTVIGSKKNSQRDLVKSFG